MNMLALVGLVIGTAVWATADTIVLKNGKTIEGDVVHFANGNLTIRTDEGKTVTGNIENIQEIRFADVALEPPATAQVQQPEEPLIPEFQSVAEIFQKLPADLQPHKDLRKINPLLEDKLRDWFRDNAVGTRLVFRSRDLMTIDKGQNYIASEVRGDQPFTLGGVKYYVDKIRCQHWKQVYKPEGVSAKQSKLIAQLQAQGKTWEDFEKEQFAERDKIHDFLSGLTLSKCGGSDTWGVETLKRATPSRSKPGTLQPAFRETPKPGTLQPAFRETPKPGTLQPASLKPASPSGSKLDVTGTIESISTRFESYPREGVESPWVAVYITLKDVTVKDVTVTK